MSDRGRNAITELAETVVDLLWNNTDYSRRTDAVRNAEDAIRSALEWDDDPSLSLRREFEAGEGSV